MHPFSSHHLIYKCMCIVQCREPRKKCPILKKTIRLCPSRSYYSMLPSTVYSNLFSLFNCFSSSQYLQVSFLPSQHFFYSLHLIIYISILYYTIKLCLLYFPHPCLIMSSLTSSYTVFHHLISSFISFFYAYRNLISSFTLHTYIII